MNLKLRRVVTGHDARGKAIVLKDEISQNVSSRRAGQEGCVLWTTSQSPADNNDETDRSAAQTGTTSPNGTVFRIVRYEPGVTPRMHRSDSIDYAIILEGAIVMQLDDGVEVTLERGDTLIQRGTVHNWINRGTVPCVIAFVLIDAKPVEIAGKKLTAVN
jgi:quercetin dioxygenase-like cupin family protein